MFPIQMSQKPVPLWTLYPSVGGRIESFEHLRFGEAMVWSQLCRGRVAAAASDRVMFGPWVRKIFRRFRDDELADYGRFAGLHGLHVWVIYTHMERYSLLRL